jgi:predicted ATPase
MAYPHAKIMQLKEDGMIESTFEDNYPYRIKMFKGVVT